MKVLVTNYTFNASAKTISFNNYSTIDLSRLLLITNATRNTIIYNFASPALGGTVRGNTITLNTSTVGMLNTDALQIFYENEDVAATDEAVVLLRRIMSSLRGAQNVDSQDRMRVALDVSNIGNFPSNLAALYGTADIREMLYTLDRTNFGSSIRPLLT